MENMHKNHVYSWVFIEKVSNKTPIKKKMFNKKTKEKSENKK